MEVIAYIETDFKTKFGLPRQSSIIKDIKGRIVFEKKYRDVLTVRGLEEFSHIWVIWEFSKAKKEKWSPTVRPPMLGGNKRMGVFATRSPFRPNPVGLSSLKIEKIDLECKDAPVIYVSGCDMMDKTPIYDIKPYLPYCDSHPEASGGFAEKVKERNLDVVFPEKLLEKIQEDKRAVLLKVLKGDPRPSYQNDSERQYGFLYANYEIGFTVDGETLTVNRVDLSSQGVE